MDNKTLYETEIESAIDEEGSYSHASEKVLVDAARRDPAAFSTLYRRYATPVYRYLYQRVGNCAEAEDLTSQVFTDVLQGLIHYRERGNFTAWLFTIARHKAIAAYRSQRRNIRLEEAEEIPGPAEDPLDRVVYNEQMVKMAALFSSLKENQRELLRLRFSAGLGYAEIGAVLGRSQAAVKMALIRLLHKLSLKWEGKR